MGTKKRPEPIYFLDDIRGIYIPRDFAQTVDRSRVSGVTADDWSAIENPEAEGYWDSWADVCDKAVVTDHDGVKYHLYQDGALWLIPEGMVFDERTESHIWPEDSAEHGDKE